MALVTRPFLDSDLTLTPLFRFLDEFNNFSTAGDVQTFTPKFDIQEHKHSYSLHGELPGIEGKDVEIEFSDPQVRSQQQLCPNFSMLPYTAYVFESCHQG